MANRGSSFIHIDLDALAENWQQLDRTLGAKCQCAAVVKANAYGLGMAEVAAKLVAQGCKIFFVANVAEGVELRQLLGSSVTIAVLQGSPASEFEALHRYQLIPVLISLAMLHAFYDWCTSRKEIIPFFVKVNTGMNRLGLQLCEFKTLLEQLSAAFWSRCECVMSHMACADEPDHPLNHSQLQRFERLQSSSLSMLPKASYSLANSSSIFLGKAWHFDIARPGAALYGINPLPGQVSPMRSVVSFFLPILQVFRLKAGDSVGYGAQFYSDVSRRVIVAAGGYADGVFRSAEVSAYGFLAGQRLPILGRVSMDSVVFDATNLKLADNELLELSVELFGEHIHLDEFASACETIPYEVLARLGARSQRVYLNE